MTNTISTHPFEPFIPENATKLIIGTIPPYRFCVNGELFNDDVRFYYGSRDNEFWDLISKVTNEKIVRENTEQAIEQRKSILKKLGIGITDIIETCYHINGKSDDGSLKIIKQKDIRKLLKNHPQINTLIYTSTFVKSQMNTVGDKSYHTCVDKNERTFSLIINGKEYKAVVLYSPSPNALRGVLEETRLIQYKKVFAI